MRMLADGTTARANQAEKDSRELRPRLRAIKGGAADSQAQSTDLTPEATDAGTRRRGVCAFT